MVILRDNGYDAVTLDQGWSMLTKGIPPERRPVVLTFDDGFRDFYTNAFPVLDRFGFRATMFLPTAFIGRAAQEFKHRTCLTWNEVRELHKSGVEFGSHTVSHPQLRSLTLAEIESELARSKDTLEQKLGEAVRSFSYPYAFPEADWEFRSAIRGLLASTGYQQGVSTIIGTASLKHDSFFLPRLPVNSHDHMRLFRAKLEGSYDWLHAAQYLSKLLVPAARKMFSSKQSTIGARN